MNLYIVFRCSETYELEKPVAIFTSRLDARKEANKLEDAGNGVFTVRAAPFLDHHNLIK